VWGSDNSPEKLIYSLLNATLTTPNPYHGTPTPSLVRDESADSATRSIISTLSNVTDGSYSDGGFVDWRTWTLPPTGRGESRKSIRIVYI